MTKQQEWDDWMKQINLDGWLKANPGKTEADYDLARQRNLLESRKESYRQEEIRQQNIIDRAAWKTAYFIWQIINWVVFPAILAFGLGLISSAELAPRFIFSVLIVMILKVLRILK